jgi:shikimate kinase
VLFRSLLRQHPPVVWLRAGVDTLVRRVGSGSGRPLLAGDPKAALERLMAEREPLYREVANAVVDVDDHPAEEVVALVLESVAEESS